MAPKPTNMHDTAPAPGGPADKQPKQKTSPDKPKSPPASKTKAAADREQGGFPDADRLRAAEIPRDAEPKIKSYTITPEIRQRAEKESARYAEPDIVEMREMHDDECETWFEARSVEFPGLFAGGPTPEDAKASYQRALAHALAAILQRGQTPPTPGRGPDRMKVINFRAPTSEIEWMDAHIQELRSKEPGMDRSKYLRQLIEQDRAAHSKPNR